MNAENWFFRFRECFQEEEEGRAPSVFEYCINSWCLRIGWNRNERFRSGGNKGTNVFLPGKRYTVVQVLDAQNGFGPLSSGYGYGNGNGMEYEGDHGFIVTTKPPTKNEDCR